MKSALRFQDWSTAEHAMFRAFAHNAPLDLTGGTPSYGRSIPPTNPLIWPPSQRPQPDGQSSHPHGHFSFRAPAPPDSTERDKKTIRAEVIRTLLLTNPATDARPAQRFDLTGAYITGHLDLSFAHIDYPLRFTSCEFDGPLTLTEARLRSVSLRNCHGWRIDARHAAFTGDLDLKGIHLDDRLLLSGAHLNDGLCLTDASVHAPNETVAVDLTDADVNACIQADGMRVWGGLSTRGAAIGRSLEMADAFIFASHRAANGGQARSAWSGDGMTVKGHVAAPGLYASGEVSLLAAEMLELDLESITIVTDRAIDDREIKENEKHALSLDRLKTRGELRCKLSRFINSGIRAVGASIGSTINLRGALIGAWNNASGAVKLTHAQISSDLLCEGIEASGPIDLRGARIGGSLELRKSNLQRVGGNRLAYTLIADSAEISGHVRAFRYKNDGLIQLHNVKVGEDVKFLQDYPTTAPIRPSAFALTDTVIMSATSSAVLSLSGATVSHNVLVDASGSVTLAGAHISGDLDVSLSWLAATRDEKGRRRAAADLAFLTAGVLTLKGHPLPGCVVDLTRTRVRLLKDGDSGLSGSQTDDHGRLPPATRPAHTAARACTVLDGFEYDDIDGLAVDGSPAGSDCSSSGHGTGSRQQAQPHADCSADEAGAPTRHRKRWQRRQCGDRLRWVDAGTSLRRDRGGALVTVRFIPQPYQQLAAVYERAGKRREYRWVMLTMCQKRAKAETQGLGRLPSRLWNAIQNVFVGYGYAPERGVAWLVGLASLAAFLFFSVGATSSKDWPQLLFLPIGLLLPGTPYQTFEPWSTGLSVGAHIIAAVLILFGLTLGTTVVAALIRIFRQ